MSEIENSCLNPEKVKNVLAELVQEGVLEQKGLNYRPNAKYKSEYCATAFEELAQGKSVNSLCFVIGVTPSTLKRWRENYSEFEQAVQEGLSVGQAWWEEEGRNNVNNRRYNNDLYIYQMLNRYGWTKDTNRGQLGGDGTRYIDNRKVNVYLEGESNDNNSKNNRNDNQERQLKIAEMLKELGRQHSSPKTQDD